MADVQKFADWALEIDGTSVPFEPGSLNVNNEFRTDEIRTGNQLQPEQIYTLGKKPMIEGTLLDPSDVTDWLHLDETSAGIKAYWQAYDQNGGLSGNFISLKFNQCVIFPVSLSTNQNQKATLGFRAIGRWHGVTPVDPVVIGTDVGTSAAVTKAYYPKSLTIGAASVTQLVSMSVNWNFTVSDDDQLEPVYYYYSERRLSGSAVIKDLAEFTESRFLDSAIETTLNVVLEDRSGGGAGDISFSLGKVRLTAEISGEDATINFNSIGN